MDGVFMVECGGKWGRRGERWVILVRICLQTLDVVLSIVIVLPRIVRSKHKMRLSAGMPMALGKQVSAREKVFVFQGLEALDWQKTTGNIGFSDANQDETTAPRNGSSGIAGLQIKKKVSFNLAGGWWASYMAAS
jgi:hypothetical protein